MNLWLIIFKLDLTQFVVDAKNIDEAINKAISINKSDHLGIWDEGEIDKSEMEDHKCYEIEPVDMFLLGELMRRDDYWGNFDNVLVFFG